MTKLEETNENRSPFEAIFEQVDKINPNLGGMEGFGMLLALPDDQFDALSPIVLEELEKSVNNIEDKMLLVSGMGLNGATLEELQNVMADLLEKIDSEFRDLLSENKRDFLKRSLIITYNAIQDCYGVAKRVVTVPIELTSDNAKMPKYAHLGDGAVDLYCPEEVTLKPGETKIIPVDIKVALPYGYAFLIHPRSGTSAKTKLRIANSIGLIDSQYKGVIGVIVENVDAPIRDIEYEFNDKGEPVIKSILHGASFTIGKGERFAQMRLVEVPTVNFMRVKSVDGIGDDRGGGFGSSGVK